MDAELRELLLRQLAAHPELREQLRAEVDRARREQIRRAHGTARSCAGCGLPFDEYTPGCETCWNRHRNRRRYHELGPEVERERSRLRRARARAAREGVAQGAL